VSVSNLRLVPPPPPSEALQPAPSLAAPEEKTVVTNRRRFALIAGGVVVLALALAIGLGRRHDVAPAASSPKAAALPANAPAVTVEHAAPRSAARTRGQPTPRGSVARMEAEDREEAALPPRAAENDAPTAPRAEAAEIPEAPAAHRRRGGHVHERATRSRHEREAAHRKHAHVGHKVAAADRSAAREAYGRGNAALLSGNATEAAAAYAEAVRRAPSDPVGYRGLGLAYEKQGKVQDAIAAFVSYLKLSHHARDREVIARRLYHLTHPQQ
jgi:tetratricopeptide (TPR) repeat protein